MLLYRSGLRLKLNPRSPSARGQASRGDDQAENSNRIGISFPKQKNKQLPLMGKNPLLIFSFILCVSCTGLLSSLPKDTPSPPKDVPCTQNSDCILVSKNCCPCNMGGGLKAIHKLQKKAYQQYQDQTCDNRGQPSLCPASYNCHEREASTPECSHSRCTVKIDLKALSPP